MFAVDYVGRGDSDYLPPESSALYQYPQYVADMLAVLAAIGHKEVHWVGTSMGGLTGMFIAMSPREDAAKRPAWFRSFTMNDIGPFVPKAALDRLSEYAGMEQHFKDLDEAEAYFRRILAPFHPVTEAQWRRVAQTSTTRITEEDAALMPELRSGKVGMLRCSYDATGLGAGHKLKAGEMADIDMWPLFDAVRCGALLILRGATSDILTPETAAEMARTAADAEGKAARAPGVTGGRVLITVPVAGHAPALWDDEQCGSIAEHIKAADANAAAHAPDAEAAAEAD